MLQPPLSRRSSVQCDEPSRSLGLPYSTMPDGFSYSQPWPDAERMRTGSCGGCFGPLAAGSAMKRAASRSPAPAALLSRIAGEPSAACPASR